MEESTQTLLHMQAERTIEHLRSHQFAADYFETKEEVLEFLKKQIPSGSTVSVGGSVTLSQIGVLDWLTGNQEYQFFDRYHTDDVQKVFHDSFNADVYLTSSNAVTMDGILYNIDGNGNRVAALIYGPKKVYVIVGINKIVKNLEDAIERVKMVAAPSNNIRLKKDNPCTKAGMCMMCNAQSCICNQFVITRRSGTVNRIHVLIVNEPLGY